MKLYGRKRGSVGLLLRKKRSVNTVVSRTLYYFRSSVTKGVHPRHPPRTFPLGLLAPRCLCARFAHASWGEEVSSLRVGLLLAESTREKFRPRHPHSTLCICMFVVSLSLLNFSVLYNFGAHPLAMDAHSGNARGSNANTLDPSACEYARTLPTRSRMILLPRKTNN